MPRSFVRLWIGQTLGVLAGGFALLAIPSVAILTLRATPLQVGLLEALQTLAFPLLGLPVGVLVDRWPRGRVLAASNLIRAAAIATIPIAAATGRLGIGLLAAVALIAGVLDVFFSIAYQAALPDVVENDELPVANSRLGVTQSLGQVIGTGGGGALVGLVGAPRAVIAIAVAFFLSGAAMLDLRIPARVREAAAGTTSFGRELADGWHAVFRTPALPQLMGCTATANLGSSIFGAAYLLFAYRTLALSPATVGIIFVFGEIGFLGALLAPRIERRFGFGRTLLVAQCASSLAFAMVPLAVFVHSPAATVTLLIASQLVTSGSVPIYNVVQVSYRQSAIAPALQGRVNATVRTIVWGTMPIGAAIGGVLAGRIGFPATLEAGSFVMFCATAWLATPVIRSLVPSLERP